MSSIKIKGLKEVLQRLDELGQLKPLKAILLAAGATLKGKLSVYPEKRTATRAEVYGSAFQTEKQRRFFFYALNAGLITVPYSRGADPRSERFKASWAIDTDHGGLTVIIGNDTTYGPYLMDTERQSRFMAALGWPTIDQVADENAAEISKFVMYETTRVLGLQ